MGGGTGAYLQIRIWESDCGGFVWVVEKGTTTSRGRGLSVTPWSVNSEEKV